MSKSLLASLENESSPLVQVALVDVLMDADGRATRDAFEALVDDPTVDDTVCAHVRTRLEEAI